MSIVAPTLSGPTWGVLANDVVTGISPSLYVTDVLSISIFKIFFLTLSLNNIKKLIE